MTLESLGNLGEFLGALAVLVSLVYLAFQIRQNTRTVRSATHQAWVSAASDINLVFIQNPDFARVFRTGSQDPGKLEPEERTQFNAYLLQVFRGVEALYFMFLNGAIDATYWNSQLQVGHVLMTTPGFRSWWERNRETFFDPRFVELIQRDVLGEPGAQNGSGS